jgi:hypothetical protein
VEWLRADLREYSRLLAEDRRALRKQLRHRQSDPDHEGLRDSLALSRLSDDECQACKQLWHEVEALLNRAATDFF